MFNTILEPGSAAERLVTFLRANEGEQLTRRDAALKFGIAPGAVDKALEPAVLAGLATMAHDTNDGRIWRAGPLLARRTDAQPEPAAKPAAFPRAKRGPRMPPLDAATLKVSCGLPVPVAQARRGATLHDAVFNLLRKDGDCVLNIPIGYRGSMAKSVQTYMDHRPDLKAQSAILVRTVDDKSIGLWRVSRAEFNLRGYADERVKPRKAKP